MKKRNKIFKKYQGSSKGDKNCAKSYDIIRKYKQDCEGKDKYNPNCLSRKKWKCMGKKSMKRS